MAEYVEDESLHAALDGRGNAEEDEEDEVVFYADALPVGRETGLAVRAKERAELAEEEAARLAENHQRARRVNVGWLPQQEDSLKIALAGLVASVGLNRDRFEAFASDGKISQNPSPRKDDKEWFENFVGLVVEEYLKLPKELKQGILPLGMIGSDPKPLAQPWLESMEIEDLERAFGEIFAQSILRIGDDSSSAGKRYDSRTHRCLMQVGHELKISRECAAEFEILIAGLVSGAAVKDEEAEKVETEEEQREKTRKRNLRNLKVGTAAVLGAVAVGVTGGLALPAIAAGIGTMGATTGAAFLATTTGTAVFTTLFSAGGLGLTGYKMSRRLASSLKEFEFHALERSTRLHISILISGWDRGKSKKAKNKKSSKLKSKEASRSKAKHVEQDGSDAEEEEETEQDATLRRDSVDSVEDNEPLESEWDALISEYATELGEPYQLVWETRALREVSQALTKFAYNQAVSTAVKETLKTTAFHAVMAAVAWPVLVVSATDFIDSAFVVARNRALLAGEELARAVLSGAQGKRPVTLIGHGLGGLVVFTCLEHLYKAKTARIGRRHSADGIILDAVILGAPITASVQQWANVRSVVAGDLVNGYSPVDWILALLYRTSSFSFSRISGLYSVDCPGVINVDVSSAARTQNDYHKNVKACLDLIAKEKHVVKLI